jgi:hypothetical protein
MVVFLYNFWLNSKSLNFLKKMVLFERREYTKQDVIRWKQVSLLQTIEVTWWINNSQETKAAKGEEWRVPALRWVMGIFWNQWALVPKELLSVCIVRKAYLGEIGGQEKSKRWPFPLFLYFSVTRENGLPFCSPVV